VNVFLSYRRDDTRDLAGRIADRLRALRQVQRVFIDVDGIEPGVDFVAKLRGALSESQICVLLIGPKWHGPRGEGRGARIREDGDFVRLEAATALAIERKVLPVLANGAVMPGPGELPEDLQGLARINALSVRHEYFEHDMQLLIDTLLSRRKPGRLGAYLDRHPVPAGMLRALAGAAAALVLLVAGAAVHGALTQRSLEETLGGQAQVWLLILGFLTAGALAAFYSLGRRG